METRTLLTGLIGLSTSPPLNSPNTLILFDSANPSIITDQVPILGLNGPEFVRGIDFRPATGQLYAMTSASRLYTVDLATGVATQVGTDGGFVQDGSPGDIDFDPTDDVLRVVTINFDQNLRINPEDGTLIASDGKLTYAAGDIYAGRNPFIEGLAYANNISGTSSTTLYGVDSGGQNALVTISPENNGTLHYVGNLLVGGSLSAGLDIMTTSDGENVAFSVLNVRELHRINLTTGAASFIGEIGFVDSRSLTIIPQPTFRFSSSTYSVGESDSVARITVDCVRYDEGTVTVHFATANGTAIGGTDFTDSDQTLTFGPGITSQTVEIPITRDTLDESDETIHLTLSDPTGGAVLGSRINAVLTIVDDDAQMFRLYNPNADLHVFTTARPEFDALIGLGYHDETASGFTVSTVQLPGSAPIHRLYNPFEGHHYLTTSDGDRDFLQSQGWHVEPDQGFLYPAATEGATEIFHLYNNNTGDHLYTESASERSGILANPTQPPPWSQHTSLGFAFAASASIQQATMQSATELPIQFTSDIPEETSTPSAQPAVALDESNLESTNLSLTDQPENSSSSVSPVERESESETSDVASLDLVWQELGTIFDVLH